jgi:hypothetical protein
MVDWWSFAMGNETTSNIGIDQPTDIAFSETVWTRQKSRPAEVDPGDRARQVAREKAALALETTAGDDVLVRVAGQQAEVGGRMIWGSWVFAAARISGLIRTSSFSPASLALMASVMASIS